MSHHEQGILSGEGWEETVADAESLDGACWVARDSWAWWGPSFPCLARLVWFRGFV